MHSVDARENCKSINFAQENRRDSPILPPLFLPLPPGFGRGGPYIFQELQQRRRPLIPPSPFSELAGYNTTAQRFPDRGGKKICKEAGERKTFFLHQGSPDAVPVIQKRQREEEKSSGLHTRQRLAHTKHFKTRRKAHFKMFFNRGLQWAKFLIEILYRVGI